MKTIHTLAPRRLGAALLGLLFTTLVITTPQASAAVPAEITAARTAFADKDFTGMKTILDPFIAGTGSTNDEARVLRAIALAGIAAETKAPAYIQSIGGTAKVKFSTEKFSCDFPLAFTYATNTPLKVSSTLNYTRKTADGPGITSITFENRGTSAYTLTLKFTVSADASDNTSFDASVDLDGTDSGYFYSYGDPTVYGYTYEDGLSFSNSSVTAKLAVGHALTINVYDASKLVITPKSVLPTTITVHNGQRIIDDRPTLTSGANSDGLLAFFKDVDDNTLAPIVVDLTAVSAAAKVPLYPSATGHPTRITVAYPDVRLILAAIKFNQALRLLGNSFDLSLDFQGGALFDSDAIDTFRNTPAFLSAKPTSPSADRTLARSLFKAAIAHYFEADDAKLWTRNPPTTGDYLVAISSDGLEERPSLNKALRNFRDALTTPVLLTKLDNSAWENELMPSQTSIALAPLFASTAFDLRAIVPGYTDDGFIPGTSTPLLTSALIKNASTVWWEDLLDGEGLSDPLATPVASPASIKTQTTVSVFDPATRISTLTNGTVKVGDNVLIEVSVLGYPQPAYKWRKDGTGLKGQTRDYLFFPSIQTTDAGVYDLAITNTIENGGTKIFSKKVTLTVNAP